MSKSHFTERPSLAEIAGEASKRRRCPKCKKRAWGVTSVWTNADGSRRRSFHCRACGYTDNSTERYDSDIASGGKNEPDPPLSLDPPVLEMDTTE